jgi:hypothetical protein
LEGEGDFGNIVLYDRELCYAVTASNVRTGREKENATRELPAKPRAE